MPFSASPLLAPSAFPFLSYLGGIPSCFFKGRLLSSFFPVLVPRGFFCLCREKSLALFVFFLFSSFLFSVFFLSSCPDLPSSLCLKGSASIDGAWGSLLLIFCRDLFFWMLFFSGLRDPLGLSYNPFGLGLSFPSGLNSFFLGLTYSSWAYFTMIFFRPQQKVISVVGLN